ncbi:hypothetical protein ACWGJ6_07000 [Streptomyces canus]
MPRTTLLRQLLQQRHLTTHEAFAAQYERAAARLAELDRDPAWPPSRSLHASSTAGTAGSC